MSIDADICNVVQQFGCAILTLYLFEQFRRCVNKLGGIAVIKKVRVADDVFKKRQVGSDATNSKLAQRTVHTLDSFFSGGRPRGYFFKQWIIEAINHSTRVGGTAIQSDSKSLRTTVGSNTAIVRYKILFRIFSGDTTLHRVAVEFYFFLRWYS